MRNLTTRAWTYKPTEGTGSAYPWVIFVGLFALYASTAPRELALYDDAHFILGSYYLVPTYPPGYPLYILLAKLATFLPAGSVAYRVHLLSALWGALSAFVLWRIAQRILGRSDLAAFAALAFGLSQLFWSQALIAKCYTLNTFLFLVVFSLALQIHHLATTWQTRQSDITRHAVLLFLILGLALSNHWPLTVLYGIGLPVLLWPARTALVRRLPLLLAALFLGLLPYLWMWWRTSSGEALPINPYGQYPLKSWSDFFGYFSRAVVSKADHDPDASGLDRLYYLLFTLHEWGRQYTPLGPPLILFGLWHSFKQQRDRAVVWALILSIFVPQSVLLLKLDFQYDFLHLNLYRQYPALSYGLASLWLVIGLRHVVEWSLRSARYTTASNKATIHPVWLFSSGILLLVLIAVANGSMNDRSNYVWTKRYAQGIFDLIPQDADLLLGAESDISQLGYYHFIEGVRPDLNLYTDNGYFNAAPYGLALHRYLRLDPEDPGRAKQQAALNKAFREYVDASKRPILTLNHVEMLKLLGTTDQTEGLLKQIRPTAAGGHILSVSADPRQIDLLFGLVADYLKTADPWSRIEVAVQSRTLGYLTACLRPERIDELPLPDDSTTGLALSLGTANGLLQCDHDLSAAEARLVAAERFVNYETARLTYAEYYRLRGEILAQQSGTRAKVIQYLSLAAVTYPKSDAANNRALEDLLSLYAHTGNITEFERLTAALLGDARPEWFLELNSVLAKSK